MLSDILPTGIPQPFSSSFMRTVSPFLVTTTLTCLYIYLDSVVAEHHGAASSRSQPVGLQEGCCLDPKRLLLSLISGCHLCLQSAQGNDAAAPLLTAAHAQTTQRERS